MFMSISSCSEKLGFDRGKAFSNARRSFSSATTCNRARSGVTPEQLRETFVVPIADRAAAIRLNPFRMLRSERIVNVTLKLHVCSGIFMLTKHSRVQEMG